MRNRATAKTNATQKNKTSKKLGLLGFFSLTAAMVLSVHEYPTFAAAGMQIPLFLLITGFCWFLPAGLCSAEMASVKGWENGGIFTWVSGMLGKRFGFAAIFFQWFQITVCFVTILYFMLDAFAYLFNTSAFDNNLFLRFFAVTVIFWVLTLQQLLGTKVTDRIAKMGFFLGVLLVTILLMVFAILYVAGGSPLQFTPSLKGLLPDFSKFATIVVFINFIFANMGVEASASYINEMKNPKRDYPLVMLLLVILSTLLNAMGGFSVAGVVSQQSLSLSQGMVQTFQGLILTVNQNLGWLVKVVCGLLVLGVLGEVSSWIVGPSKSMDVCSNQGLLPKRLHAPNRNGVPKRMLVLQGVLVTIWAAVLTLLGGGANLAYTAAISLTTLIYMVSYILLFISYLMLQRHPEKQRGFHIPGGRAIRIIMPLAGLAVTVFAFAMAFVPSSSIPQEQTGIFLAIVISGFVCVLLLPFLLFTFYGKKHSEQIKL